MSDHLQAPVAGQSALGWLLNHLMPWLNYSRLVAGRGVKLERGAGGTLISATPTDALPFVVTITDGLVVVRAGRHYWYDATTDDYTVTTLDSTAGAWASVTVPTSGNSKFVYFTRARDAGAVTTATITKGVGTTQAAVTALANDRTKVWIVAALTADADGVVTIEQRVTEDQVDGPDAGASGVPGGVIVMWSGTTAPTGWSLCDGTNGTPDLRGKFIVGYKSSDSDYDDPGDFSEGGSSPGGSGGYKWHGQTENNHNDHRLQHITDVTEGEEYTTGTYCMQDPGSPVVEALNSPACETLWEVDSWCGTNSLPDYDVPGSDHRAKHYGASNSGADTDNRPPYYVLAFIMRDP